MINIDEFKAVATLTQAMYGMSSNPAVLDTFMK